MTAAQGTTAGITAWSGGVVGQHGLAVRARQGWSVSACGCRFHVVCSLHPHENRLWLVPCLTL